MPHQGGTGTKKKDRLGRTRKTPKGEASFLGAEWRHSEDNARKEEVPKQGRRGKAGEK